MAKLIKDRKISDDTWQTLFLKDGDAPVSVTLPTGPCLVPLAVWQAQRESLSKRPTAVGVWLGPTDDPAELAEDLALLPVIAVHFPVFRDGRGYSIGTLLRSRYGYQGELRAIGDVLRDQLQFLHRVGFDSFALRDDQSPETCLQGFDDFSIAYQGAFREPRPLFRRRQAQGE